MYKHSQGVKHITTCLEFCWSQWQNFTLLRYRKRSPHHQKGDGSFTSKAWVAHSGSCSIKYCSQFVLSGQSYNESSCVVYWGVITWVCSRFSSLLWTHELDHILYMWQKMVDNLLPVCCIMGNILTRRGTLWLLHIQYSMDPYTTLVLTWWTRAQRLPSHH